MPTITGRLLAKNTLLSLVAQITPLIVAIVAIPILLDRLGLVRLGILSLVWVLLGYAGLLDLGIARALTQRTSRLLARREEDGVAKVATSAIAANFGLGIVGGARWPSASGARANHARPPGNSCSTNRDVVW